MNLDLADQVDGGGVQAEVVETDVGASNGVIHSINRVRSTPCSSFLQNCERLNVGPPLTAKLNSVCIPYHDTMQLPIDCDEYFI